MTLLESLLGPFDILHRLMIPIHDFQMGLLNIALMTFQTLSIIATSFFFPTRNQAFLNVQSLKTWYFSCNEERSLRVLDPTNSFNEDDWHTDRHHISQRTPSQFHRRKEPTNNTVIPLCGKSLEADILFHDTSFCSTIKNVKRRKPTIYSKSSLRLTGWTGLRISTNNIVSDRDWRTSHC